MLYGLLNPHQMQTKTAAPITLIQFQQIAFTSKTSPYFIYLMKWQQNLHTKTTRAGRIILQGFQPNRVLNPKQNQTQTAQTYIESRTALYAGFDIVVTASIPIGSQAGNKFSTTTMSNPTYKAVNGWRTYIWAADVIFLATYDRVLFLVSQTRRLLLFTVSLVSPISC